MWRFKSRNATGNHVPVLPIGLKMIEKPATKTGRPRLYNEELGSLICGHLAAGKSLSAICKMAGMPSRSRVMSWLHSADDEPEYQEFRDRYARARSAQADAYFDQIVDVANNATAATAAADRVKIDALKWVAARMAPDRYGDRVSLKAEVHVERPSDIAPDWLRNELAASTAAVAGSKLTH